MWDDFGSPPWELAAQVAADHSDGPGSATLPAGHFPGERLLHADVRGNGRPESSERAGNWSFFWGGFGTFGQSNSLEHEGYKMIERI